MSHSHGAFTLSGATAGAVWPSLLLLSIQFTSHIHELLMIGQEAVRLGHEVYVTLADNTPMEALNVDMLGIHVLTFHR